MILKIWKDPVWSKVISVGILSLIAYGFNQYLTIYERLSALFSDFSFQTDISEWFNIYAALFTIVLILFVVFVYRRKDGNDKGENSKPSVEPVNNIVINEAYEDPALLLNKATQIRMHAHRLSFSSPEKTRLLNEASLLDGKAQSQIMDKNANWPTGGENINSHDVDLYEKYKYLFVHNGVAEFYRQHDFLGSFSEDKWRPLSHYVNSWETVEHEFVNKKLNNLHKNVYASAFDLGNAISGNTVPIGSGGQMRSVKPDSMPFGPIPEHIKEEAKEINELVPPFIKAHELFVRCANRKLGNGNS